ncbi:CDP-diacylglycerol--glycerol-3-phosphate 3-phosphatidyltransferase [Thermosporothrix hazakensis]|jgi:CDP-diacylglycerol--glycerol-3-phosphate 3-phosphatidyltransferase|uniref:CDP-diacylglycerol--glycerol-3-phosphate 3-phosphatidyltransferase n=2 Tax=Thermosporothrix TaxID=768650 RepID=A0A326TZB7_THEHA|nr:CDP-diacylglycerol--glycerol-3-phosphate 3-phosphatidyltransferase [Thermosporothrix hazakensis]PZW22599.1 CDP-diacylglycerol--glycerol-3-phosphate 3-phosphatidyltransferase [Thermosporothrix hazakensis]BBH90520.1 CDP-diacylglycerol--glycerol-3-phosphate 3-phosphatidyltransferase [Thermosporothrix sp. COM3]GCE48571.1 CDP-diacylglycerol--glycerol-3-phosphate 3-phosphatidyltransferase [Thermosporothrix hazakensis]
MRNIPNILSISRLISTVIVFILVLVNQPWAYLVATVLFVLASVTDFLDGYLARRFSVVSSLGVFLDLTADKVFVAAILIAMVQIGLVPAWIVAIIVVREFMVSGLRSIAAAKGKVIPAGMWGKQKTFITLVAMGGILLAKGLGAHLLGLFPLMLTFNSQTLVLSEILLLVADVLMIVATIWTIFSGVEYILGALPLFRDEAKR